jgi:hypothetical protein
LCLQGNHRNGNQKSRNLELGRLVEVLDDEVRGEGTGDLLGLLSILDTESVKVLGEAKLELGDTVGLLDSDVCNNKIQIIE